MNLTDRRWLFAITPIARSAHAMMPVSADDLDLWERKLDAAIPEFDRQSSLAMMRSINDFAADWFAAHS